MLFLAKAMRGVSLSVVSYHPLVNFRKMSSVSPPKIHTGMERVLNITENIATGYVLTVLGGGILGASFCGFCAGVSSLKNCQTENIVSDIIFGMGSGFVIGAFMFGILPVTFPMYVYRKLKTSKDNS